MTPSSWSWARSARCTTGTTTLERPTRVAQDTARDLMCLFLSVRNRQVVVATDHNAAAHTQQKPPATQRGSDSRDCRAAGTRHARPVAGTRVPARPARQGVGKTSHIPEILQGFQLTGRNRHGGDGIEQQDKAHHHNCRRRATCTEVSPPATCAACWYTG